VHTAAQVQTEIHRPGAQRLQPGGFGAGQIERDHEAVAERRLDAVGGLELGLGIVEAHQQALFLEFRRFMGEAGITQRLQHPVADGRIDLLGARRRDLDRGVLTVEIRQRIDEAGDQDRGDHQILPQWVLVDHPVERS
jgi:hypothetical protein